MVNHKAKAPLSITNITKLVWRDDFYFPIALWLMSRIVIWVAMLLIAPKLAASNQEITHFSWGIFDAWDSVHYRAIATSGYSFVNDGKQHNLAFFPLFPVSIWIFMKLGFSFELAGILINNLAFLGTLYCLYFWLKKHCGIKIAKWAIAVISWCPMSMFTGVIYTEGLYLFLSTAAMRAFDDKKYGWTALWGAMATATRPTGMALISAFLLAAWKQNKPKIAYIAGLSTATGLLLFSLYCAITFHDPLAFIAAQKGWRPSLGFDWQGWLNMLMQIPFGNNWSFGWVANENGGINDLWHPLLFSIILVSSCLLWIFRKFCHPLIIYAAYFFVITLLIIANQSVINNLLNVGMVLGSSYLLWRFRQQLTSVMVIYGFCGVGLLLASGGTISLSRLAYGIVPLNIAIGIWLYRFPRQAYFILVLFMVLLVKLAIGFSQEIWVG
jgi:Gpi18-like mannosyltransferase